MVNDNADVAAQVSTGPDTASQVRTGKTPTFVAGNPVTWTAEVMEANDYYPFGQVMPSRTYALIGAKKSRFGYNGKEKDAEVGGDDYDFGARMYDARICRWNSVDPDFNKGPQFSPYNYALNSPILLNDPEGDWVEITTKKFYRGKDGELHLKKWYNIFQKTVYKEIHITIHNLKIYNYNGTVPEYIKQDNGNLRLIERPPTENELKQVADNIKSDLLDAYGNCFKTSHKGDIAVSVTLKIDGDVKVVNSLKDVKTKSDRNGQLDDLIVLVDKCTDFTTKKEAVGLAETPNLFLMDLSEALKPKTSGTARHEFAHQHYRFTFYNEHKDGGTLDNSMSPANFDNLWKIDGTANGTDMIKESDNLKKIERKEKQRNEKQ